MLVCQGQSLCHITQYLNLVQLNSAFHVRLGVAAGEYSLAVAFVWHIGALIGQLGG